MVCTGQIQPFRSWDFADHLIHYFFRKKNIVFGQHPFRSPQDQGRTLNLPVKGLRLKTVQIRSLFLDMGRLNSRSHPAREHFRLMSKVRVHEWRPGLQKGSFFHIINIGLKGGKYLP